MVFSKTNPPDSPETAMIKRLHAFSNAESGDTELAMNEAAEMIGKLSAKLDQADKIVERLERVNRELLDDLVRAVPPSWAYTR
jgi:hypothetical protein